jgi:RNA polymerase sigma-70 factor, ECF subfamily
MINADALVSRLQAGDAEAYEHLVRSETPRMLAVARRLLRDGDLAEEAVQQAFVSAFRGIGRFRAGAQLSTWLHRIVVNAALMMLRQRRRRPEVAIESLLPDWQSDGHRVIEGVSADVPADEQLQRAETRAEVRAAIDRLPDLYRTAVLLRDIEELSIEEGAMALDITPNAFKIRVHRGRQALLTLLTKPGEGTVRASRPAQQSATRARGRLGASDVHVGSANRDTLLARPA